MKGQLVLVIGVAAVLVAPQSRAASGGPDELWEMSVRVEMPGMPMMMGSAPHASRICVEKDRQEKAVPLDKNCVMTDFKRSGNKTSYSFKCSGGMEMTGSGQATISSDRNSYQGSMQARGSSGGHAFEMKQSYTGKRVGNCTAEDSRKTAAASQAQAGGPSAIMAQQANSRERMCTPDPAKYELTWPLYTKTGICANYRNALCQRAKNIAGEMSSDPEAFVSANEERQEWAEGMKSCGIDPDKIPPPCKKAVAGKKWEFVAAHCPKETTTIAKKECAGRDYTSAMESEYRPICVKFASDNVGKNVFKEGSASAQGSSAKSDVAGGAAETLKNGIKGMFGF